MSAAVGSLPIRARRLQVGARGAAASGGRGTRRDPRPSRPRAMFAWRSRFEPSGVAQSLTCSARSRSSPIRSSTSRTSVVDHRRIGDVVARGVEVARVEADPEPRMPVEPVEQRLQLLERAADRAAGAGRVLDQQPRVAVAALEDLRERAARCASSPASKPGAEMRADVEDDAVGADRARRRRPSPAARRSTSRGSRVGRGEVDRGRARGRRRRRSRARHAARWNASIASG